MAKKKLINKLTSSVTKALNPKKATKLVSKVINPKKATKLVSKAISPKKVTKSAKSIVGGVLNQALGKKKNTKRKAKKK